MNDPRNDEDRLIAEVFHGDWERDAPVQFARRAAASARRRRRIRHSLVSGTVSAALLAVAAMGLYSHTRQPPAPPASAPAHQAKVTRGYEIISDAELLAELRDRSIVMVKKANGTNEFVLIGE